VRILSIRNRNAAAVAIASLVAVMTSGAAAAGTSNTDPTAEFVVFVNELHVDAPTAAALTSRFDALSADEQRAFLETATTNPLAVVEFEDDVEPTVKPAAPPTYAGIQTWTATYPVTVSVLGIDTGTFSLSYTFQGTSISTTKNLECRGWFSGFAGFWSISSTSSNYISGSKGTCKVVHRMSAVYKGSFVTANKEQSITFAGPTLIEKYTRNV